MNAAFRSFCHQRSLKTQLTSSFSLVSLFTGGVTLAICLGMLYGLASLTYDNADQIIIRNTRSNSNILGQQMAATIEQQLRVVAESVTMTSALYAKNLLDYSTSIDNGPIFKPQNSYREYNFESGCSEPNCPSDFGPLAGRSRLPFIPGFKDGSMEHSSVYMYSSQSGESLRDDASWSTAFTGNPAISRSLDALAYQDEDMEQMYKYGSNTTVMYYLSAQVFGYATSSNQYHVLHRTYPGMKKNDSFYNPVARSWFQNAGVGSYNLYGPYRESFTKQLVITISSKQITTVGGTNSVQVVSAAVMLLKDLADVIQNIDYTDNGFGALIRRSTSEVLVWGNRDDIFDYENNRFRTVSYFDSILAQNSLSSEKVIEYTDAAGMSWIVSVQPFFQTGPSKQDTLVLLVFSEKEEARAPLTLLGNSIDDTTAEVSIATVIIVCATIGGTLLFVGFMVTYITYPLEKMRVISEEVINILAEDDDCRDFTDVVQKSYENVTRNDEIGVLAMNYYHLVSLLQDKLLEKRSIQKYPPNPFFIPGAKGMKDLTFAYFMDTMGRKTIVAENRVTVEVQETPENHELDVLASLASTAHKQQRVIPESYASNPYVAVSSDSQVPYAPLSISPSESVPMKTSTSISLVEQTKAKYKAMIKEVTIFSSLKSKLYCMSGILLAGMVIAMVLTILAVQNQGETWTEDSDVVLNEKQTQVLQSIADTKTSFVQSYFQQMDIDLVVIYTFFYQLMSGDLLRNNWLSKGAYLGSYAIDPNNPYAYAFTSSNDISSYFVSEDANCQFISGQCAKTHDANTTRQTSLADIKLRAAFYTGNSLSFGQVALEKDGFTRYLPYSKTSTNSNPSSCLITNIDKNPICRSKYLQSKCSDYYSYTNYPAYDARCRPWYQLGKDNMNSTLSYFQYPRQSSNGKYVLSAVIPLHARSKTTGEDKFIGVYSNNYLAQVLADNVNRMKVLKSGYCYVLDTANITNVVLHPKATTACSTINCAEGFTTEEYQAYRNSILIPLQQSKFDQVRNSYRKKGKEWRVQYSQVKFGTVHYILLVTAPTKEILEVSYETQDSIDSSTTAMIVVFSIVLAIFAIVLVFFTRWLIRRTVDPIRDLEKVISLAKDEDYSGKLGSLEDASSSDMKALLEACSRLLVALRFGSRSFGQGDFAAASVVFKEALSLFSALNNSKGIGSCLNNLAAVELSCGRTKRAIELYGSSIENAKILLSELDDADLKGSKGSTSIETIQVERKRLKQVLSDREGNLAVAILAENDFARAFELLESLLERDKGDMYIRGCIMKQGILGQYYCKQHEFKSAERFFNSALQFLVNRDSPLILGSGCSASEIDALEQIALYNLAVLQEEVARSTVTTSSSSAAEKGVQNLKALNEDLKHEVIHKYLYALLTQPHIQLSTSQQILARLKSWLIECEDVEGANALESLAKEYDFVLDSKALGGKTVSKKRVVFAVDYSGSMSGGKIRAAIDNVVKIIEENITDDLDYVQVMTFSSIVNNNLALQMKTTANSGQMLNIVKALKSPTGSTALYDCIEQATNTLQHQESIERGYSNWMVVLTDGEDNASRSITMSSLVTKLRASPCVNLIVIGVGADVQHDILSQIALACEDNKSSRHGIYISADSNQESITKAFGEVVRIIQSQVVLEDY